jgi:hypothetical protein
MYKCTVMVQRVCEQCGLGRKIWTHIPKSRWILPSYRAFILLIIMEAQGTCETSVNFCQTTRRHSRRQESPLHTPSILLPFSLLAFRFVIFISTYLYLVSRFREHFFSSCSVFSTIPRTQTDPKCLYRVYRKCVDRLRVSLSHQNKGNVYRGCPSTRHEGIMGKWKYSTGQLCVQVYAPAT